MFGDILEQLTPGDLHIAPGLEEARRQDGQPESHILLARSIPSNKQILDATKRFYSSNQTTVDLTAHNCQDVASLHRGYVEQLNTQAPELQHKDLTPSMISQTSIGIFDKEGGGSGDHSCHGLFGPTLCHLKASDLFSTISVGISVEAIFIIGGYGGLGCSWDITGREGPKGYGFATLELGAKVEVDINVQAAIFNRLPSRLNTPITVQDKSQNNGYI